MRHLLLFSFLLLSFNLKAKMIACTHPQVCNIINSVMAPKNTDQVLLAKKYEGDPHHSSLTSSEVKKFIKSDLIIGSPISITPWLPGLIKKLKQENYLQLSINSEFNKIYNIKNNHILGHFWLYPQILCSFQHKVANWLKLKEIKIKSFKCKTQEIANEIKKISNNDQKRTLIVSHNALKGLLQNLGFEVISLRGSLHHEKMKSSKLKKLIKLLQRKKNTPVTWIYEKRIKISSRIKSLARPYDKIVKFDTLGKLNEDPYLRIFMLLSKIKR